MFEEIELIKERMYAINEAMGIIALQSQAPGVNVKYEFEALDELKEEMRKQKNIQEKGWEEYRKKEEREAAESRQWAAQWEWQIETYGLAAIYSFLLWADIRVKNGEITFTPSQNERLADVITKKWMEAAPNIKGQIYKQWLYRM